MLYLIERASVLVGIGRLLRLLPGFERKQEKHV
jgi:hypothetical protein